jgi:hypothetical protein
MHCVRLADCLTSKVMGASNVIPVLLIVATMTAGVRQTLGVAADNPGAYASTLDKEQADETDSSGEFLAGRDAVVLSPAAASLDGVASATNDIAASLAVEPTAANATGRVSSRACQLIFVRSASSASKYERRTKIGRLFRMPTRNESSES